MAWAPPGTGRTFSSAIERLHVPMQNFGYADVDGNIGYAARGAIPVRTAGDGTLPAPGWTIHDSCSARRELGIHAAPRALLGQLAGVEPVELKDAEVCCGFGGTFCVKYPDISARMVSDKAQAVVASGADVLVSGDLGCLMNIAGRLKRMDSPVRVYHLAELLAGMTDVPGIGEGTQT